MNLSYHIRIVSVLFLTFCFSHSYSQFQIDLETGAAWNGYNDVRVPNQSGSSFSLSQDQKDDVTTFFRLQLLQTINNKHTIRLLYAPLKTISQGTFDQSIRFAGETFPEGTLYNGIYQFNSYRLTYRYAFSHQGKFRWGLGATAKIRDARIEITGANLTSEKTDFGFVPLINFNFEWYPAEQFSIQFTGDALVSPNGQGRAEDVLLGLRYHHNECISLKAGYRILEGGADVEEVYNFTLFHFAVIGGTFTF
ncbi:MAG: hypothetical protein ACNS62_22985 [Candidatus Cyclobacteriaceae bacterium M3_2C_046]